MCKWNNKGLLLFESLVAFILFSLMLMLYLPAYHQELQRLDNLKKQTNQWHLLAELIKIDTLSEEGASLIESRINEFEEINGETVNWVWDSDSYQLVVDGSVLYEVRLLNTQ